MVKDGCKRVMLPTAYGNLTYSQNGAPRSKAIGLLSSNSFQIAKYYTAGTEKVSRLDKKGALVERIRDLLRYSIG